MRNRFYKKFEIVAELGSESQKEYLTSVLDTMLRVLKEYMENAHKKNRIEINELPDDRFNAEGAKKLLKAVK